MSYEEIAGYTSSIQLKLLFFTLILFSVLLFWSEGISLSCISMCIQCECLYMIMFTCILLHVQEDVSGFMHVNFNDQPRELTLGLATQVINPCAESFLEYVKVSFLCGALTLHHSALWYNEDITRTDLNWTL